MESDPHIPAPMEADLTAAFRAPPVPAHIDEAVLGMARRLGARRRSRRTWRIGVAAAAAAALAVVVWVVGPRVVQSGGPAMANTVPGDLNGDGKIDMLDALILATHVEKGEPGPDLTSDGKTDKKDVDALAMSAVRLDRGSL